MELKRIEAAIEAILFANGDEVSLDTLSKILEVDKKTLANVLNNMMDRYINEKRGIQIIQLEDKYQLRTTPEFYEYVSKLHENRRHTGLSQAALETLSIIAYKQPITKVHIDEIRGVGSDASLSKLLERNIIKEVGRMNAPGKPILYGTTDDFLRGFGFKSIKELPVLEMLEENEE